VTTITRNDVALSKGRDVGEAAHAGYRPDIDGLRAIAVLPVVFYHVGVRGFSGGFVGVDVFFVISGYLITGILTRDVAAGRYSIAEFYRRRVLRIFPALFAMFALVTVAACLTMLPTEIYRYARSLGTAALFSSNVQFYVESDYFDLQSAAKPLLHTWSLAVEEQWYILWPLLIAGLGKRGRMLAAVALGVAIVSLGIGVWQTSVDMAGAFYLLPARAWELGLGALLAINGHRSAKRWLLQAAGVLGLALIFATVKVYTHETDFPGLAALAPCVGAALLIYSGAGSTWVSRALSVAPAQFVGKISYSLYLWHWPVIVFTNIGLLLPQTPQVIVAQIALSLILATLSWRFVEQPFREGNWSTRNVLAVAAIAIAFTVSVASVAPMASARLMGFSTEQIDLAKYADLDGDRLYRRGSCFAVGPNAPFDASRCLGIDTGKPAIVFVGDSHAAALWPGLSRHADRYDILQATATGCVAKYYERPERTHCAQILNSTLRDWLPHHSPKALILASRWKWNNLSGLEATLSDPKIQSAHPLLIGPMPEYSAALPRILVFADRRNDPSLIDRSRDADTRNLDHEMRAIAERTNTSYLSMIDLLCSAEACLTRTPSGAPLQFDGSHLTPAGSALIADAVLRQVERLAPTKN
jgi:peptidoglycan/LPS O-acetylase OafA/YrhL